MNKAHLQIDEVSENYESFKKMLPRLMEDYAGKFAVMKNREIVEFMDTFEDALKYGYKIFGLNSFSIQEVTQEVVCIPTVF